MSERMPESTPPDVPRRLSPADVDAVVERLFAPPAVDPGQTEMNGRQRPESGEMRLALAVLEDALRCVLRHHGSRILEQRLAARDALTWMQSDDDAPPFTFVRVCQLFDLDPDWIRQTVHRHLQQSRVQTSRDERSRNAA